MVNERHDAEDADSRDVTRCLDLYFFFFLFTFLFFVGLVWVWAGASSFFCGIGGSWGGGILSFSEGIECWLECTWEESGAIRCKYIKA